LPVGKKGFQQPYPPLYVLLPDGSTLYSYRDVVYSLIKVSNADLVLNVICSEQDLPQQKVALTLMLLNPNEELRQVHVSYELVKLTQGRMSGRRARYLTGDELYEDLKAVIIQLMQEQQSELSPEQFEVVADEVSTAAMKYALLSTAGRNEIQFDLQKVTNFSDASAPFLLYNSARFNTLFQKFQTKVDAGELPPLPSISETDLSLLTELPEWDLFFNQLLSLSDLVKQSACPSIPPLPALPEFATHKLCDYLVTHVRDFSAYWGNHRIIQPDNVPLTHARVQLCNGLRQGVENALHLLGMKPLTRM